MTTYRQTTLPEMFGTGTVDWDATSRLFAEIICSVPKKTSKKKEER
jgi:hypothetical protein